MSQTVKPALVKLRVRSRLMTQADLRDFLLAESDLRNRQALVPEDSGLKVITWMLGIIFLAGTLLGWLIGGF